MKQWATVQLIDGSDYNAFACSVPECSVYFSPLRGYEDVRNGTYRQAVLNPLQHPKCDEHDLYMMLMMPSGEDLHEWACPVKSCKNHVSYPVIKA